MLTNKHLADFIVQLEDKHKSVQHPVGLGLNLEAVNKLLPENIRVEKSNPLTDLAPSDGYVKWNIIRK